MLKPALMMLTLATMPAVAQETSPSRLDAVDAAVAPIMEAGQFPGVVVAVQAHGEPVHQGAYGYASLEHSAPARTDTVFELASLTKHMTALMVLAPWRRAAVGWPHIIRAPNNHASTCPSQAAAAAGRKVVISFSDITIDMFQVIPFGSDTFSETFHSE